MPVPPRFSVNVKSDFKEVYAALNEVNRRAVKGAAAGAINRAATSAKTEALKQIQAQRALPATQARKELSVTRAVANRLVAILTVSYEAISLAHFRVHNTRRGQGPISVQTIPSEGYKPIKGAWVKAYGGGTVIFQRVGRGLHDIKKLFGPSLPSVIRKDGVSERITTVANESWLKNFKSQLEYRLRQIGFKIT